ncbi:TP53-regulated inhibitor of apoptosis 1-like [Nilaparvata lugens]|uniref:TP53-regulated inhibitor of apoptosis 1-like n=1 Tax=Nilaparvata lugens TaxID=108931 RepID=UPI000B989291|nr:TP53-regulated inhibitor of apoptosis 1-like [Nilaparvata lugens]XP_039292060.1 TP53-regulated inhibitor of apoptosis 1-like [Nilaparvata lugens]
MNSVGLQCTDLKQQYDACFQTWFTERFLKGDMNDEICAPLFRVYQQCLKKTMKEKQIEFKEVDKDHLGTDKEYKSPKENNHN